MTTILSVVLMVCGLGMVGFALAPREPDDAPLPVTAWSLSEGELAAAPVAADPGTVAVDTYDDEGNVTGLIPMTVDRMASNHLFVPSLAIYAPFVAHGLDSTRMLVLPDNPRELTVYEHGARPSSEAGTVLISGHVSKLPILGALYPLSKITPNAVVYMTDDKGVLSTWAASRIEATTKQALPDKVFTPSKTIVGYLVTCGGPVVTGSDGRRHLRDNVIVTLRRISVGTQPAL